MAPWPMWSTALQMHQHLFKSSLQFKVRACLGHTLCDVFPSQLSSNHRWTFIVSGHAPAIRGPLTSFFSSIPTLSPIPPRFHPSKPPNSTPQQSPAGAGLDRAPEGSRALHAHGAARPDHGAVTLDGGNKRVSSMERAAWEQNTAVWGDRGGEVNARIPADQCLMLPAAI